MMKKKQLKKTNCNIPRSNERITKPCVPVSIPVHVHVRDKLKRKIYAEDPSSRENS